MAFLAGITSSSSFAQDGLVDHLDASGLSRGGFHLGLFVDGEQGGFMRLGWEANGEYLDVFDRSMLAGQELYETMEVRLGVHDLAPVETRIRFHQGATVFNIDVTYDDAGVHNQVVIVNPGEEDREMLLETPLPEGTVPRVAAFVAASLLTLGEGETVGFSWYAPMTHAVEDVSFTYSGLEKVDTPAGQFQARRYELRGGAPENDIFVDEQSGQVVRIDVLGQDMQFLALPPASG